VNLPYWTTDLPGIAGAIKCREEDFVVDEIPAYAPSGTGDHVFVRLEKRDLNTAFAVGKLARALGVRDRDIGVAGQKDRRAITTQWLSLPPPITPEQALALELEGMKILEATRHNHKLRTGHLRGNRFRLIVRNVTGDPATVTAAATAILARLAEAPGAPNWYGEQRFGRAGDNAARGRAFVTGEAPQPKDRKQARFLVSALQSSLFNDWLTARLADGLYRVALAGDVMHKRAGGMFDCTEPEVDTPRIAAGEITPTGPMFGVSMRAPAPGPAADREAAILAAAGLSLDEFRSVSAIAEGARRDAAIEVTDPVVRQGEDAGTLEVSFALPAGAYATVVMREVMKMDESAGENAESMIDAVAEPT
jgi:tRNA pseudouridine13 synthase